MNGKHWEQLIQVLNGEVLDPLPTGFIIDSPWLPNWYGKTILDYFTNDELWLEANFAAIEQFPDTMFLPGFWSEYGMCTEPSAFGIPMRFPQDQFPHAHKAIDSLDKIDDLPDPDPETDGLLPFVLNRLKLNQSEIESQGHKIRFAVARGPLNVASYLVGTTELMTGMMTKPKQVDKLMQKVTKFLKKWLQLQIETFSTIDGILMLDDIVGFIGEDQFKRFGLPYMKELYDEDVSVKFFHNDAACKVSAPFLPEIGINLFNMGYDLSLSELKDLTDNKVTLLGNIPPRDVLASGSPEEVKETTIKMLDDLDDLSRILPSCGGGMPPEAPTENIEAFIETVRNYDVG